jgi:hypothetical protein
MKKLKTIKCIHIPHDSDKMQTICEKCGKEIEPKDRGSSDCWHEISDEKDTNEIEI